MFFFALFMFTGGMLGMAATIDMFARDWSSMFINIFLSAILVGAAFLNQVC